MILSIVIYPSNMFICLSPWPDQTMFDDFCEFLSQGAGPVRHVIGRDPRPNGRTRVFSGGCSTSRNGQNSSTVGEFCPRIWWRWHNLNISQLYSYSMYRCGKLQGGPRHINFDLLCWWLFFLFKTIPCQMILTGYWTCWNPGIRSRKGDMFDGFTVRIQFWNGPQPPFFFCLYSPWLTMRCPCCLLMLVARNVKYGYPEAPCTRGLGRESTLMRLPNVS